MKDSYGKATSGKIAISIVYLLVLYALYLTFIVAPPERFMGAVQRIFYFHVGSAVATYCAFGVLLCAALSYLGLKNNLAKFYLRAGSETSLLFASITLASGMIWAHSAWNVWFRWEPRLVTFLLLWLISLSIVLLWKFGSEQSVTKHASVLSILGSLMVPIVVYAIKLMPNLVQLHPEVVENQGLKHPGYSQALYVSMIAIILLQFLLTSLRARIAQLETE